MPALYAVILPFFLETLYFHCMYVLILNIINEIIILVQGSNVKYLFWELYSMKSLETDFPQVPTEANTRILTQHLLYCHHACCQSAMVFIPRVYPVYNDWQTRGHYFMTDNNDKANQGDLDSHILKTMILEESHITQRYTSWLYNNHCITSNSWDSNKRRIQLTPVMLCQWWQ